MNHISRFECGSIACHTYNNTTLGLSNDDVKKILAVDYQSLITPDDGMSDISDISDIRRVLADALIFIYVIYRGRHNKEILLMNYKTWDSFFTSCFSDIIHNGDEQLCLLARQLRRRVNRYSVYYGNYVPFMLTIVNTNDFLRQVTILACITTIMVL